MSSFADKLRVNRRAALLSAGAAALCSLWLLSSAAPSQAAFEQVGCFAGGLAATEESPAQPCAPVESEEFIEEVQLGGVGGMAVNYTGAGGVAEGTVYAATRLSGKRTRVAMFVPTPGGLKFSLRWEVTKEGGAYARCGPGLGVDGEGEVLTPCSLQVEEIGNPIDVDVDESSGNVYVYNGESEAGLKAIVAYSPDGSSEITRFGELAPFGESVAASPAKIHGSNFPGAIAVNGAGEVYVFDEDAVFGAPFHRLAKFKPKTPGDFSEYEYAAGEDVAAALTSAAARRPTKPVADAAGNLYVASESTYVEMYDPGQPAHPPVCTYKHKKGGITAITVDPVSGSVFFFSLRIETGFARKTVHELGPCNPATEKFEGPGGEEEVGEYEVAPERDDLWGLAYDPGREFSAGRPAGTLYGGAPGPEPNSGEGEPDQSSLGYIFAPLQESPPQISGEAVEKVKATSAQLGATVDPAGFKTHYVFEYLTDAAYKEDGESFANAKEAPAGGAYLAGTGSPQAVGVTLSSLAADTAYRYRVVATSNGCPAEAESLCETVGSSQSFHTYPFSSALLPDNRAYELVSPAQKHGGQVLPADPRVSSCGLEECKPGTYSGRFPMQSAPSGDAVAYEGTPFSPGEGAAAVNAYIARRDPLSGWQSANPTPGLLFSRGGGGYKAYDEGLGRALLSQEQLRPVLDPAAPPEYENLYAQPSTPPFAISALIGSGPPNRPATQFTLRYTGASADLSRVFFAADDALTAALPGIAPAAIDGGDGSFNLYEWQRPSGQLRLVNVGVGNETTEPGASFAPGSAHPISTDGSRAFFADHTGQLYVREGGVATREIPDSGEFLAAATDGSKVLLANGHIYDLETETTTDLSAGEGGFLGIAGQSDDLSHLYFLDTAVLSGGEENCREGAEGEVCEAAAAGKNNLYSWTEGELHFIAQLDDEDNADSAGGGGDWQPAPSNRTAQASPAGRYLAFLSVAQLTGYDNVGPCAFIGETGEAVDFPCSRVFLYDSQSGDLTCPSCNPSGSAVLGHSSLRLTLGGNWLPQPRYLTDSGRLFFDSQESLSPHDTNGGVEDVYQFEPQGLGSCTRSGGCLTLISAGREAVDSNFLAADPGGENVFFTTRDRLVAQDKDDLLDLYDARVGGGFAFESELTPGGCSGEGCQPPPPATPEAPPSSVTLQDPGNVPPPKGCKKGKVRRKGKCVKKQKHKRSKHHKRHKNKSNKHNKNKRGGRA